MMFDLGLTGSIGMGKSTTAQLFADRGCLVWDADAAVHELYGRNGAGSLAIETLCPSAVTLDGVDRAVLKAAIAQDQSLLPKIEGVIHPLVAEHRAAFRATASSAIRVFDIPLLFEKGSSAEFDAVACVSVGLDIQRQRVLARPGMTEETFQLILSKQLPNEVKVAQSDYVIDTATHETAAADVDNIITQIKRSLAHA